MFLQKLLNKGVVLTQEFTAASDTSRSTGLQSRWRENHGNVLLMFVAAVIVLGASVLIYRQNRFVAPRFPESDMITPPPRSSKLAKVAADDSVTVRVVGAANNNGMVRIVVYDSESTFDKLSEALISESVPIHEGVAVWTIPVQMPNRFSIAAYHDENSDSQLNRNQLDVPTERYGYSGNARAATGLPSFQDSMIARPKAGETIDVFIR